MHYVLAGIYATENQLDTVLLFNELQLFYLSFNLFFLQLTNSQNWTMDITHKSNF